MPTLNIQNQLISYTLNRSTRAKRLSMRRTIDQWLVVSQPSHISDTQVDTFLTAKSTRILKHHTQRTLKKINTPDLANHTREHYLQHKRQAMQLAINKVEQWSKVIPYPYNTIKVKQLKTKRWSCSNKKNLNFNYKILFLEESLQDYLVVHEMCHLREMNHSHRFRGLVEEYYGPYQVARKTLRTH